MSAELIAHLVVIKFFSPRTAIKVLVLLPSLLEAPAFAAIALKGGMALIIASWLRLWTKKDSGKQVWVELSSGKQVLVKRGSLKSWLEC
jgi:hypothetical protein